MGKKCTDYYKVFVLNTSSIDYHKFKTGSSSKTNKFFFSNTDLVNKLLIKTL